EGVPALVEAAREHRIDELLIRPDGPDAHREVWIGEDPDQVAVRRPDLKILGEQRSGPARADDALIRSAAMTDASALVVGADLDRSTQGDLNADRDSGGTGDTPDRAADDDAPVGGLGALLRWKGPVPTVRTVGPVSRRSPRGRR